LPLLGKRMKRRNHCGFGIHLEKPAQTLASALPITEEQAVTLVKSGFTNLEGLHAADVQDLVDILGVDEAKAREIHDAVHKQDVTQEAGSAQGA